MIIGILLRWFVVANIIETRQCRWQQQILRLTAISMAERINNGNNEGNNPQNPESTTSMCRRKTPAPSLRHPHNEVASTPRRRARSFDKLVSESNKQ